MPFPHLQAIARLALALALLSAPIFANSNRKVAWKTYATPHFEILFHDDIAPQARLAREFLEGAYAKIAADLGMRERGIVITVVLTGLPDESNGYATPLGHRMVIYTRPMQVLASADIAWLKRVLAHELTHQITFLALRKSFWGVYSEIYKSQALPAWFMEGLAQYEAETWDAKRNTFFAHALYNSALEPYPDLATYTKTDPVTGRLVYEQGHAFIRFLAARQGPGFIAKLLARIRVIPVWNEIKSLLSPWTGSILPLEGALRARTGVGIRKLYSEFADSLRAGLPPSAGAAAALRGGVPGFAVVYQMKLIDSAAFLFTGQKDWDQPQVALYESRRGKVRRLGPQDVNPVFDLSPDGKRVAYVRTFLDVDGDPVERVFVSGAGGGEGIALSEGAAHPAFLSNDTLAFSHYAHGRQALAICALGAAGEARCRDEAPDSLAGFFALSRSSRGLLLNATDTAGRTGIYEYAPGAGFLPVYRDSVPAEFPVETADGAVLMLRERRGLLQVDALDRASGRIVPGATYPLGTFYLHNAGAGIAASVAQVGKRGQWGLEPVAIEPPPMAGIGAGSGVGGDTASAAVSGTVADSIRSASASLPPGGPMPGDTLPRPESLKADSAQAGPEAKGKIAALTPAPASTTDSTIGSTAPSVATGAALQARSPASPPDTVQAYRKPGFLVVEKPIFPPKGKPLKGPPGEFNSLLAIQPLLMYPAISPTLAGPALGAVCLLQDPLEMHTMTVMGGLAPGKPAYGLSYLNQQSPVGISLMATNTHLEYDSVQRPAGWKYMDVVTTADVYSAGIDIPFPSPANTSIMMGLRATAYFWERSIAGQRIGGRYESFDGWSDRDTETDVQIFFGTRYLAPYAYALAHPLWLFDLEAGGVSKTYGPAAFLYARGTFPVQGEVTLTGRWQGEFRGYELHAVDAVLPDGNSAVYFRGGRSGIVQDGYAGLDFPLHKGYMGEWPVLGLWNYLGAGLFGSYYRTSYEHQIADDRYEFRSEVGDSSVVIGGKLTSMFHVMRRIPLVLSFQAGYDIGRDSPIFRLRTEIAGIPSTVSLRPGFETGLGNARRRGP